jgi:hypothetical protein
MEMAMPIKMVVNLEATITADRGSFRNDFFREEVYEPNIIFSALS